jgi:hypothetical protein
LINTWLSVNIMKKIITITVLLLGCSFAKAQNNLQFNRVVIIQADTSSTCSSGCPDSLLVRTFTENKVLKIESINYTSGNYALFLDNVPLSKSSSNIMNHYPVWLPSGTYTIYYGTYVTTNSAAGNYAYLLSALEFNVVQ